MRPFGIGIRNSEARNVPDEEAAVSNPDNRLDDVDDCCWLMA
jgi:hypothetical protein